MENEKDKQTAEKSSTSIGGMISNLVLIFFLLWVWDGFWTTNIGILNNFQSKYFPEKHLRENLKSQTQAKNLSLIKESSMHADALNQSQKNLEKACRYIESSRMLLANLQSAMTPDQIAINARCTSKECEALLSPDIDKKTNFCE